MRVISAYFYNTFQQFILQACVIR